MLIIMKKGADEDTLVKLKKYLVSLNYDFHQSTGANRTIIGVIGDTENLDEQDIKAMPGVLQVVRIAKEE
jgi:hypothetical protein